ncbi:unnamed protein product [Linum trigynum]|uniref:Uncharacterized protein n=1 Tax=Linum trigynum TaxID=586398 RepID=A0AAV2DXA5_9ROSI
MDNGQAQLAQLEATIPALLAETKVLVMQKATLTDDRLAIHKLEATQLHQAASNAFILLRAKISNIAKRLND